jgi:branched-chain amino acid transport system substrate-binding protein
MCRKSLLFATLLTVQALLDFKAHAEPPIKVGISAPLSGAGATFGADLKNVILFANQKLANGRYDIVVEDDRCEGKAAVSAAHKLVGIDKVRAAFFACDTAALVAARIYRSEDVLVITPLVTSPRFSKLGRTFFRLAPNDADNARILVSHISNRHKKLGILTEGASEYSEDLASEIEKAASQKGLTVVHERFGPGTADFKSLLLRLQSRGVDSLFINPTSEEPFLIALRQLKQLGISLPLFGSYTPGSATFLTAAGPLAEGITYSDFPSLPQLDPTGKALFEEFKQQFGPLNTWDFVFATGMESFRVMHAALEADDEPEQYIHRTQFQGLIGHYSFNQDGDISGVFNELRQVREGRGVLLEQR